MRTILALVLVLYSAAAFAQSTPPTVGGKPLVQVKPARKPPLRNAAPRKPQSIAAKLQACLEIDDGTKGRLDCYDAIFPPKPNPKAPAAKGVADCRFTKEEDERLTCFNGFRRENFNRRIRLEGELQRGAFEVDHVAVSVPFSVSVIRIRRGRDLDVDSSPLRCSSR